MPINASIGEKLVGFNILISILSPSMPVRLKIQEVIVVPTLAPIITPMARESFIMPELTKPTTITVVADEDCITAVTKAPTIKPLKVLEVIFQAFFKLAA